MNTKLARTDPPALPVPGGHATLPRIGRVLAALGACLAAVIFVLLSFSLGWLSLALAAVWLVCLLPMIVRLLHRE